MFFLLTTVPTGFAQWEKANPVSAPSATIFDIAYGQNQWIAVGDRGLIALRNGDSWNELPSIANTPLRSIACVGTRFVAVGDNGLILASAEGNPSKWSVLASPTPRKLINIQQLGSLWFITGESGLILNSSDGLTWTILRQADENGPNFTAISWFGSEFVGVVANSDLAWHSPNGVTWTADPASTKVTYPRGLRALNGYLVAWGSLGGLARSSDGHSWTKITSPLASSSDGITDIIYANARYFLTGSDNFLAADRPIYSSTDLTTWSATDGSGRHRIVTDGTQYVAAKGYSVETSPDGLNWKKSKGYLAYPVIFSAGQFRAVDRNFLYSSADGLTWTESRLPTGVSGLGIYEANGKYLIHNAGKVAVSTDLLTWQTSTFTTGALGADFLYAFNKYYAVVRSDFSTAVYASSDARTWSSFATGVSVAFGNSRLVIVNSASNTFQFSVSTNGTSTTSYSTSGQPGAKAVAYGNGLFVAVSGFASYKIRTSPDGVTWTAQTPPAGTGDLSEIAYKNGRFIARGKGTIITSTDAVTWTNISYDAWEDEDAPPYSVAYGNNVWVLAGGFPLRSADFPNWTLLTDVFDHTFIQVRYLQSEFWAVSQTKDNITTGSLWRSTDGLDWKLAERFPFIPADVAISPTGRVVVVGADYSQAAISDDLVSWQLVDPGLGRVRAVIHHGDNYYAATQAGVKQSPDGVTWAVATGVPSFDCVAIASSPLGVTAVGSNSYSNKIYHSADGVSWAAVYTANTPQYLNTICYSAPYLIASGGSGYFLKSSDGNAWTVVTSAFPGTLSQCITTNNGLLAVSDGVVYRSPFVEPVTLYSDSLAGYTRSVAHGNNISVAVGNDSCIYRKTTAATPPPPTGFTAVTTGDRYITLSWQNETSQPAGFMLQYRLSGAATWLSFGNILPANPNSITVTGLLPSSTYEFRILSVESGATSVYQALPTPLPVTIKPIQEWRRLYFGSVANSGGGADLADPDADGILNLMEYALSTNPLVANAQDITLSSAPYPSMAGYKTHSMAFWCNGLNTDINYRIETSRDLATWTLLEKSVGGQRFQNASIADSFYPYPDRDPHRKVTTSIPTADPKFFFRVKIESTE